MKQGPLKSEEAGRLWASAFVFDKDPTTANDPPNYRSLLAKSPRAAAKELFKDWVEPLLNTTALDSYSKRFYDTLNAKFTRQEQEIIRDTDLDQIDPATIAPVKLEQLKRALSGNEFFFWKKGERPYRVAQDIDGPLGADRPLARKEWVRVYTKANLEPDFKNQLEKDPAAAVQSFAALGHTADTPIFNIPTLEDLWRKLPDTHELKDIAKLRVTLQAIADGAAGVMYDAELMVHLTC